MTTHLIIIQENHKSDRDLLGRHEFPGRSTTRENQSIHLIVKLIKGGSLVKNQIRCAETRETFL